MAEQGWEQVLGAALHDMGRDVDFGDEPDLVLRVRDAIKARTSVRVPKPSYRRLLPALVAAILIAAVLVASLPGPRHAIARALGISGISIEFGNPPVATPGTTPRPGTNLFLGRATSLQDARSSVDFPVRIPARALADDPDRIYVSSFPPGGRVSLAYGPSARLPKAKETGLGMLVTEFRSSISPSFVKKLITTGATVTDTSVDGAPAYWIEGAHFYMYEDSKGNVRQDTLRLSSNALVWERGGVTLRIESALSEDRALAIARSMS